MSENNNEIKREIKESNIQNNENSQINNASYINNNQGIRINNSIFASQIQPDNPILVQLIEFGYNPLYSKRIIQLLHPRDIEEAIEYFSINNKIIQHHFIRDRNQNNILCYICGGIKEKHIGYIPENNNEINNREINIQKEINEESNNNEINNNIENNNNVFNKDEIKSNEITIQFNNNEINNNGNNNSIIHYNEINNNVNSINEINNNINENYNIKNSESNNSSLLDKIYFYHKDNYDQNLSKQNICSICNSNFISTNKNTVESCKHSFCDNCWYNFLEVKIKENKLSFIKCLNYECPEKLSDEFIIDLLQNNNDLIQKYKQYKFEFDIINDQNLSKQNICSICNNNFISTNKNTVESCKHSFCDNCWYNFLEVKIKENKLSFIKCLNYECPEKLSDEFIIDLLQNNNDLIQKYKGYKFELDIINDPNKKLCPFPNCDSYLIIKNEKFKVVTCKNKHTYCFFCLEKPHGKLPCKEKLDNSMIEFAKNNFIKRCPKCSIITQKNEGCNHITCPKCNYQWCWLCNGEYSVEHYREGKCKGYQFYRPKNENDINLALQGKIVLSNSQRQEDVYYPDMVQIDNFAVMSNRPIGRQRIIARRLENIYYLKLSIKTTILMLFIYIIFGHSIASFRLIKERFFRKSIIGIIILANYFLIEIAHFFTIIYLNLIMLIPYLINLGFFRFTYLCRKMNRDSEYAIIQILLKTILFTSYFFFGGFYNILALEFNINNNNFIPHKITALVYYLIAIIYSLIYFPLQFIINQIVMIIILIKEKCNLIQNLNKILKKGIGLQFNID